MLCWYNTKYGLCLFPANATHISNVGLMLAQRRRRWPNIEPILGECLVLAGLVAGLYWQMSI